MLIRIKEHPNETDELMQKIREGLEYKEEDGN